MKQLVSGNIKKSSEKLYHRQKIKLEIWCNKKNPELVATSMKDRAPINAEGKSIENEDKKWQKST